MIFLITGQSGSQNSSSEPNLNIEIQDSYILNSNLINVIPGFIVMDVYLNKLTFFASQNGSIIYFPNVTISNFDVSNISIYIYQNSSQEITFLEFDGVFGITTYSMVNDFFGYIEIESPLTEDEEIFPSITLFDINFDPSLTENIKFNVQNLKLVGFNYLNTDPMSIDNSMINVFVVGSQSTININEVILNDLFNVLLIFVNPTFGQIDISLSNSSINNIIYNNPGYETGLISINPLASYLQNTTLNILTTNCNFTNIYFTNNSNIIGYGGLYNLGYLPSIYIGIDQTIVSNITSISGNIINYLTTWANLTSPGATTIFNISNSLIKNNTATNYGTIIYAQQITETFTFIIENNSFNNNYALQDGDLIYSNNISLSPADAVYKSNEITNSEGENLENNMICGPPYQMMIKYMYTNNNQTYQIANNTIGLINASTFNQNGFIFTVYLADQLNQQVIDYSQSEYLTIEVPQNNLQLASPCSLGVCTFNGSILQLNGTAGSLINISFQYVSTNFQLSNLIFYAQMRSCIPGELNITNSTSSFLPIYSCQPCPLNTYSFNPDNQICYPCNFSGGATCNGGNFIYIEPQYWRLNINSTNVYQCTHQGRCLGGNYLSTCATGYKGPLCDACDYANNYVSNGNSKCGTCNGSLLTFGIFIVKLIFILCYDMYFIRCTRKMCASLSQTDEVTPENLIPTERTSYLRIFTTYYQIITVAYSFDFFTSDLQMLEHLNLFNTVEYIQDSSQNLNPLATIYSSLECVYLNLGWNSQYFFYYTVVYTALLPIFKGLLINLIRLFIWGFKVNQKRKAILYLTFVCIYIVDLPATLNGVIAFINCTVIDGTYYAISHMNTTCFQPNDTGYWLIFLFVVLPSLIIWTFLIPIMIFYLRKKYHKESKELYVRLSIGAFNIEFKDNYWYFGLIVVVTKSLLIIISNLSFVDTKSKALICGMILYLYSFKFYQEKPMRIDSLNRCEIYAFSSFILFIFFGLFCYDNQNAFLFIFGLMLNIGINIWIFSYIVFKLSLNLRKSMGSTLSVYFSKSRSNEVNQTEISLTQLDNSIDEKNIEVLGTKLFQNETVL